MLGRVGGVAAAVLLAHALDAGGVAIPVGVGMDGRLVASGAPAGSADGRFVAFMSADSTIVPDDTNFDLDRPDWSGTSGYDVFVRDRATCRTERVSVGSDGTEADDDSGWPHMSPDGRWVAFTSRARTLVAGTPPNRLVRDVYLHDRHTRHTERVSIGMGDSLPDGDSAGARVSADGRFVAFSSNAYNLVPGDIHQTGDLADTDVFVRDRVANATRRLSLERSGDDLAGPTSLVDMSDDARRFLVRSAGALSPDAVAGAWRTYLVDVDTRAWTPIDVLSDGTVLAGDAGGRLSADGCVAALASGAIGIAVYDCTTGTTRIALDVDVGGSLPVVAGDGRRIAFRAPRGVFLHDRTTGGTARIAPAEGPMFPADLSYNGRVFVSASPVIAHEPGTTVPSPCEIAASCTNERSFAGDDVLCPLATWRTLGACADVRPGMQVATRLARAVGAARAVAVTTGDTPRRQRTIRHARRALGRAARAIRAAGSRRRMPTACVRALHAVLRDTRRAIGSDLATG